MLVPKDQGQEGKGIPQLEVPEHKIELTQFQHAVREMVTKTNLEHPLDVFDLIINSNNFRVQGDAFCVYQKVSNELTSINEPRALRVKELLEKGLAENIEKFGSIKNLSSDDIKELEVLVDLATTFPNAYLYSALLNCVKNKELIELKEGIFGIRSILIRALHINFKSLENSLSENDRMEAKEGLINTYIDIINNGMNVALGTISLINAVSACRYLKELDKLKAEEKRIELKDSFHEDETRDVVTKILDNLV